MDTSLGWRIKDIWPSLVSDLCAVFRNGGDGKDVFDDAVCGSAAWALESSSIPCLVDFLGPQGPVWPDVWS